MLEDYTRFVLDDDLLSGELKNVRHDLSAITLTWGAEAILHRDTPGDVGTTIKTDAEQQRDDVDDVVIAAGKRLGEALRAMEEYSKTIGPLEAAKLEAIRYRFYDIEQAIGRTLRADNPFKSVRLCVLITQSARKRPWLENRRGRHPRWGGCVAVAREGVTGRVFAAGQGNGPALQET